MQIVLRGGIPLLFTWIVAAQAPDLAALARLAVSPDAAVATTAIMSLRSAGAAGLDALFNREPSGGPVDQRRQRDALDAVAQQRDAYAAHLYWYTDRASALEAARALGRPVLSLRLLGKLTDEFSCANSRFFRTALYGNAAVAVFLREHFVLHWESVRAVPRVTIDFGDGRILERTITGNSIHYVIDEDGVVIDALPGLYGPGPWLERLGAAHAFAARLHATSASERATLRRAHLIEQVTAARDAAAPSLVAASPTSPGLFPALVAPAIPGVSIGWPTAEMAARAAVSKAVVELPIVRALDGRSADLNIPSLRDPNAGLRRYLDRCRLDASSMAILVTKVPTVLGESAADRTTRIARIARNFELAMAEDTLQNDELRRPRILEWMLAADPYLDVAALNDRVYAELFLTPASDPWLGLNPPDTYCALPDGGTQPAPNGR